MPGGISQDNEPISFVVASNDDEVLRRNFLASPGIDAPDCEVLVQRGYASASLAYNAALDRARHDLVVFVHQDLFLPEHWRARLGAALAHLGEHDANWGVLGVYGVDREGRRHGHVYSHGWGVLGRPFGTPAPVRTIDEIFVAVRKSGGLRFDGALPHYHFYGTDICLSAEEAGRACYALPLFCIHNTRQILALPDDFYAGYRFMRRKWWKILPVETPCVRITRLSGDALSRRVRAAVRRMTGRERPPAERVAEPAPLFRSILQDLDQRA